MPERKDCNLQEAREAFQDSKSKALQCQPQGQPVRHTTPEGPQTQESDSACHHHFLAGKPEATGASNQEVATSGNQIKSFVSASCSQ